MGQKVCHFYKAKNLGLMSKVGQHKDLRGQASYCFFVFEPNTHASVLTSTF